MSVVSGVTLITSLSDGEYQGSGDLLLALNDFLKRAGYDRGSFIEISSFYGGSKHPQCSVYAGGFNHFSGYHESLITWVAAFKWENPENVVLVIQPEEGETIVFRPLGE